VTLARPALAGTLASLGLARELPAVESFGIALAPGLERVSLRITGASSAAAQRIGQKLAEALATDDATVRVDGSDVWIRTSIPPGLLASLADPGARARTQ